MFVMCQLMSVCGIVNENQEFGSLKIQLKCVMLDLEFVKTLDGLLIMVTDMSVALMQQENGTPHCSTPGLEQLKYSFLPQSL